ncbi:hypothetical protein MTR67_035292, partial [Solanum verrucosum]
SFWNWIGKTYHLKTLETRFHLYRSGKEILEIDLDVVDEDNLGQLFFCDIELMGYMKGTKIYPKGKDTIMHSKNQETYIYTSIHTRAMHGHFT